MSFLGVGLSDVRSHQSPHENCRIDQVRKAKATKEEIRWVTQAFQKTLPSGKRSHTKISPFSRKDSYIDSLWGPHFPPRHVRKNRSGVYLPHSFHTSRVLQNEVPTFSSSVLIQGVTSRRLPNGQLWVVQLPWKEHRAGFNTTRTQVIKITNLNQKKTQKNCCTW